MPNTTPISNQLNLNLAGVLDDGITSTGDNGIDANTDGAIFSASKRNQYLAEAYRWLVDEIVARVGMDEAAMLLPGLVITQTFTWSNTGTVINKDYMYPVAVLNGAGTQVFNPRPTRAYLAVDTDPNLDAAYTMDAKTGAGGIFIFGYQRSAGVLNFLNSTTASLFYFGAPRVDSTTGSNVAVNTTPDVQIDPRWYDACTMYAAFRAAQDKGEQEWNTKGQVWLNAAVSKLPQTGK